MLKLRTILLYNYPYYLLLIIVLLISIPRLILPKVSNYSTTNTEITGIVIDYDYSNTTLKITLHNKEKLIINYYLSENKKININVGDKIKVIGEFTEPTSNTTKYLFNYKKYLYNKDIFYIVNATSIKKISSTKNIYYKLKQILLNITSNSPYLKAFILGDTSQISQDVKRAYQEIGINHLLAIGGMQITILSQALLIFLKKIKVPETKRYIITSVVIIIYFLLIEFTASSLRGLLFFFLFSINQLYYFYIKPQNIFLVVLAITLLINPYFIYDIGFQYSFLISITLILTSHLITGNYLLKLLKTSTISFLISIPISLYNYFQINIMSIIYNMFYVPFVNVVIFPMSILTVLIKPLLPIYNVLIFLLEKTSLLLSNISLGKLIFPRLPIIIYIIYFIVIIIVFINIKKHNLKPLVILSTLLLIHYIYPSITRTTYIKMIDVGQGDSILMHSNNESILFDTGGKMSFSEEEKSSIVLNTTIPLLKSLGIRKLKYLVLTHGDADHMGEAKYLIKNFNVENILINEGKLNYLEKELISLTSNVEVAKEGKYISCGDIDLVQLNTDLYDENDSSQVYYGKYNDITLLFTGDASLKSEDYILNNYNIGEIDILKVGHHGSKTSTGKKLLETIKPKYALISCGKDNKFGHPNESVIDNLSESKIYRTDLDGSVKIKITNNKIQIEKFIS
ncbi:MAG: DNA internalization-related competence protein ComEC/Rec2 [Bacilli bacterium]|nr:DNA internalization-related competence protein ComEC/Rec2 [Bacilli bacterium]